MPYGLKSTQQGIDVKSEASPEQTYRSGQGVLKTNIYSSPIHFDTLSYTFAAEPGNGVTQLVVLAHGYGYTPAHLTRVLPPGSSEWSFLDYYQELAPPFPAPVQTDEFEGFTDGTNLVIQLRRTNGGASALNGTTWGFKYLIFVENGV